MYKRQNRKTAEREYSNCVFVGFDESGNPAHAGPVSYTHLDVYKRQLLYYVFRILSPAAAPRGQPKQGGYRGQRIDISYDLPAVCQFILSWRDKMDLSLIHI